MKKFLLVVTAIFLLSANCVYAKDLYKYSNDTKVTDALEVLESIGANDVFSRLDKNEFKIMFYDLSLMDFSYAKHFAVSSTDENGNNYILINERFRYSPKEAIACLIAHESVHVSPQATLNEETRATTEEAQTWIKLRGRVSTSEENTLIARENKLARLYQSSTTGNDLIRESIAGNSFYQQQLAMK